MSRVTASLAFALAAALAAGPLSAAEQSAGTKFVIAIEGGNLAGVKALVESGESPDAPVEYGEHKTTPLNKAAWNGRRDIVKYLLAQGAKVNGPDSEGQTPLQQAVTRGFDDVVDVLLAAGADPKAADTRGNTPFSSAMFGGHFEVAEALLKAGADPNAAFTAGITPLMGASSICNVEAIRFLVKAGAKVDKVSQLEYGGQTALTTAVSTGQTECVKELLEQGANPTLKMKDGSTAISKAKEGDNKDVLALLEGAAARFRPKTGVTAKATAKKP